MDMNKLMKQAKKMQQEMAKQQEEMATKIFEASSGGGMVVAKVNGKNEVVDLKIEEDVVDKQDIGMLQDLVMAAINEAHQRAQDEMQNSMSSLMGGMKVPGLF